MAQALAYIGGMKSTTTTTATKVRRTMTAMYDGYCKGCNTQIKRGQQITYERLASGARTRHVACDAKPAMARVSLVQAPVARQRAATVLGVCRKCGSYCYGDCEA